LHPADASGISNPCEYVAEWIALAPLSTAEWACNVRVAPHMARVHGVGVEAIVEVHDIHQGLADVTADASTVGAHDVDLSSGELLPISMAQLFRRCPQRQTQVGSGNIGFRPTVVRQPRSVRAMVRKRIVRVVDQEDPSRGRDCQGELDLRVKGFLVGVRRSNQSEAKTRIVIAQVCEGMRYVRQGPVTDRPAGHNLVR